MRRSSLVLVALALSACTSGSGGTADDERTVSTVKAAPPGEVLEIPVEATRKGRPGNYASRRELEWAADWAQWEDRFGALYDRAESILKVPSRRDGAIPGTNDHKRLRAAMQAFRSCSERAVARGAPPTRRLEPVAAATAAVCEHVEKAAERWRAEGFDIGFPDEAILADTHFQEAIGAFWEFIPGLEFDVPLLDRASRSYRTQIRYTLAASRLLEGQVTVTCHSLRSWRRELHGLPKKAKDIAGFVHSHTAGGHLAPAVCRWLDKLVYRRERPQELPDLGYATQAVLVLAHEAQHAVGVRNEAKAECYAMQYVEPLARLLGADASYAALLEDFAWTRIYPIEPPGYTSAECRPGGSLDLRKRVAAWP